MPSKTLSDADFVQPLTDSDFQNPELVNETSPDVSWWDRAAVKNFGVKPEDSVSWLQERHPELKVTHENGDIFFEKDGKKYPLDPKGFDMADLTDIPVDIAQGIGTTAATAAGGAVGNLPGGVAAGAAANTGLELLKQKIGQAIGVNKGEALSTDIPSANKLKWAAVTGGAAPVLFGTGASAAEGLAPEAAQAFENANKGMIPKLWNAVMSKGSGIAPETIQTAKNSLPEIKTLENSADPVTQLGERAVEDFGKIKQSGKDIGTIMNQARAGADTIPMEAAQAPVKSEIQKLEEIAANEGLTNDQENTLNQLKDLFAKHFDSASASPAKSLAIKTGLRNASQSVDNQVVANAAERASGALGATEQNSIPALKDLNPRYAAVQDLLERIGPAAEDKNKAYNLLQSLANKTKTGVAEDLAAADAEHGTNLIDTSKLIGAFDTFRKSRPFQFGWNQIKQRAPAEAVGASAGGYAGYKSGGGYPAVAAGALGGAGLGATAASPAAIRTYLQLMNTGAPLAPAGRAVALPIWNMLLNKGE